MTTRERRKAVRNARGKYTFHTAPVMQESAPIHKHRYKPPAEKGKPLRYRVHVIRNVGHKESMIWIPLACYKHLSGAYKKVNALRAHFNKHHNNHVILRDYTIFIEFRGTGMIRAFNLNPEYSLNSARTASTPGMGSSFTTSWYTPKNWIMHEEYRRSKTKKRSSSAATSVPMTGGTPKATPKPDKGKATKGKAKGKGSTRRTASPKRTSKDKGDAPNLAFTVPVGTVLPPTILDHLKQVIRYFQTLVPTKMGQTA